MYRRRRNLARHLRKQLGKICKCCVGGGIGKSLPLRVKPGEILIVGEWGHFLQSSNFFFALRNADFSPEEEFDWETSGDLEEEPWVDLKDLKTILKVEDRHM